MRTNGFQRPLHVLQVCSWIFIAAFAGVYYGLFSRVLPHELSAPADAIYTVLLVSTVLSAAYCTWVDPSDPHVAVALGKPGAHTQHDGDEAFFCCLCQTNVNRKSKHCRICDKCVDVFDHHCKWLNNCVGARNYRVFLLLMFSSFFLVVLQIIVGVGVIAYFATDRPASDARVDARLTLGAVAHISVVVAFEALALPVVFLLGQLLYFHIYLVLHNQTTYEFIVAQREEEAPAQQQQQQQEEVAEGQGDAAAADGQRPPGADEGAAHEAPATRRELASEVRVDRCFLRKRTREVRPHTGESVARRSAASSSGRHGRAKHGFLASCMAYILGTKKRRRAARPSGPSSSSGGGGPQAAGRHSGFDIPQSPQATPADSRFEEEAVAGSSTEREEVSEDIDERDDPSVQGGALGSCLAMSGPALVDDAAICSSTDYVAESAAGGPQPMIALQVRDPPASRAGPHRDEDHKQHGSRPDARGVRPLDLASRVDVVPTPPAPPSNRRPSHLAPLGPLPPIRGVEGAGNARDILSRPVLPPLTVPASVHNSRAASPPHGPLGPPPRPSSQSSLPLPDRVFTE
eukprot:tig00020816_g14094.t1